MSLGLMMVVFCACTKTPKDNNGMGTKTPPLPKTELEVSPPPPSPEEIEESRVKELLSMIGNKQLPTEERKNFLSQLKKVDLERTDVQETLVSVLNDPNPSFQDMVVSILIKTPIHNQAALRELVKNLVSKDQSLREKSLVVLAAFPIKDKVILNEMVQIFRDPSSLGHKSASSLLNQWVKEDEDCQIALIDLFHDANETVRNESLEILTKANLVSKKVIEALVGALRETQNNYPPMNAARLISRTKLIDPDVLSALRVNASSKNQDVRLTALSAITKCDPQNRLFSLINGLEDSNPEKRSQAAKELATHCSQEREALFALVQKLYDESPDVRENVGIALEKCAIRDDEVLLKIVEVLCSKDDVISQRAFDVLVQVKGLSEEVLMRLAQLIADKNDKLATRATQILKKQIVDNDKVTAFLIQTLQMDNQSVRERAASVLINVPPQKEPELLSLVSVLSHEKFDIQTQALKVLLHSHYQTNNIWPKLQEVLSQKEDLLVWLVGLLSKSDSVLPPQIQKNVLELLNQCGKNSEKTKLALIKLFYHKEKSVRENSILLLSNSDLNSLTLIEAILGALKESGNQAAPIAATKMLYARSSAINSPQIFEAVRHNLSSSRDKQLREQSITLLNKLSVGGGSEMLFPLISELETDKDPLRRVAAIKHLAERYSTDPDALLALTRGLYDDNNQVVDASTEALIKCQFKDESVLSKLLEFFQDESSTIHLSAFKVLSKHPMTDEKMLLTLSHLLSHSNPSIADHAAKLLVLYEPSQEAVSLSITQALQSTDPIVRQRASNVIRERRSPLPEVALIQLVDLLYNKRIEVQENATGILSGQQHTFKSVWDKLEVVMQNSEDNIKFRGAYILCHCAPNDGVKITAVNILASLLNNPDQNVRSSVLDGISHSNLKPDNVVNELEALCNRSSDASEKIHVVHILAEGGEPGSQAALLALARILKDPDARVRDEAVKGLMQHPLKTSPVVDQLFDSSNQPNEDAKPLSFVVLGESQYPNEGLKQAVIQTLAIRLSDSIKRRRNHLVPSLRDALIKLGFHPVRGLF